MYWIYLVVMGFTLPMALGKVKPNPFYGFRTKKSMSSEEAWYKLNKLCGIHFFAISLIFLGLDVFSKFDDEKVAIAFAAAILLDGLSLSQLAKKI